MANALDRLREIRARGTTDRSDTTDETAHRADTAGSSVTCVSNPTPLGPEELRRRYARHLADVAGTLDTLAAEKLAAWIETALDDVESDPAVGTLGNADARRAAARVLAAAGIPDPEAEPLRLAGRA
ncbi:MAG: hypothetical protein M5U32_13455 [Myxococcota bacterium]|nr:hypothetical protein [Myxococcota bacterium]